MLSPNQRLLGVFVIAVALFRGSAQAQAAALSFDELQQMLKARQTVVVIDENRGEVKGRVNKLSTASITVGGRTLTAEAIREIRRPDPLWNGMLIGAAVGTGSQRGITGSIRVNPETPWSLRSPSVLGPRSALELTPSGQKGASCSMHHPARRRRCGCCHCSKELGRARWFASVSEWECHVSRAYRKTEFAGVGRRNVTQEYRTRHRLRELRGVGFVHVALRATADLVVWASYPPESRT
jgi:hypothetical protein